MVEFGVERKVSADHEDVPGIGAVVGLIPLTGITGLLAMGGITVVRDRKGLANIIEVHDNSMHLKKGYPDRVSVSCTERYYWVEVG